MDEKGSGNEFQDWEVLREYDDAFPKVYSFNFSDSNSRLFQVIEADSTSIRLDYFSLRNHEPSAKTAPECLVESENLNSNDNNTDSENRNCGKTMSELGSETGDGLLGEYESHANGLADITKNVTGFEEITTDAENLERRETDDGKLSGSPFAARGEPLSAKDMYSPIESGEFGEESESQDGVLDDSYSNSSGNDAVAIKSGDDGKESDAGSDHLERLNDISKKDLVGVDGDSSEKIDVAIEEVKVEAKSGDVEAQRWRVVWWKVPFQVLRYCFLRASPAWSFSVAAAFMGMVILGRRLYRMKRKSQSLHLKIAVDDKHVHCDDSVAFELSEAKLIWKLVSALVQLRENPILESMIAAVAGGAILLESLLSSGVWWKRTG